MKTDLARLIETGQHSGAHTGVVVVSGGAYEGNAIPSLGVVPESQQRLKMYMSPAN